MPELIDKAKVLKYLTPRIKTETPYGEGYNKALEDAAELVALMPTIEPDVRHGRWIDTPLPNSRVAKCSLCGFWQRTNGDDKTGKHLIHNAVYRYCAGCGARMDLRTPTEVQLDEADSVMMGGADNG